MWDRVTAFSRSARSRWRRFTLDRSRLAFVFVVVLGAVVAGGAWFYIPSQVGEGAFTLSSGPHDLNIEIVEVVRGEVTLSGPRKNVGHPGILGLQWEGGYAQLGPVTGDSGDGVTRGLLPLAGGEAPPVPGPARIDSFAFSGDPSTRGVDFREVQYGAPLGEQAAWVTEGGGSTWVMVVHGKGATREEALRILPTLEELGLTSMVITYRNDRESIQDPEGVYEYGATEWADLAAAVSYAIYEGEAEQIVLYGYSMGGAISVSFLQRSVLAHRVVAVVLDAPMLDFAATVELALSDEPLIGRFAGPLRWLTGHRLDIDWEALDYLDDDLARVNVPILLFHGTGDDVVPIETSERLNELLPDGLVDFVTTEGAGHVRSWNVDPDRYEARVRDFLERELAP